MAATFMLPLAIGICEARGAANSVMIDAFGTIALIAMAPPISIQIAGVAYKLKLRQTKTEIIVEDSDDDIIELVGIPYEIKPSHDVEIIEFSFDYTNV